MVTFIIINHLIRVIIYCNFMRSGLLFFYIPVLFRLSIVYSSVQMLLPSSFIGSLAQCGFVLQQIYENIRLVHQPDISNIQETNHNETLS